MLPGRAMKENRLKKLGFGNPPGFYAAKAIRNDTPVASLGLIVHDRTENCQSLFGNEPIMGSVLPSSFVFP